MLVSESKLRKLVREVIKEQKEQFSVGDLVHVKDVLPIYFGHGAQDLVGLTATIKKIKGKECIIEFPADSLNPAMEILSPCNLDFIEKV